MMNDGLNLIRCISFPYLPQGASLAERSRANTLPEPIAILRRNHPFRGVDEGDDN